MKRFTIAYLFLLSLASCSAQKREIILNFYPPGNEYQEVLPEKISVLKPLRNGGDMKKEITFLSNGKDTLVYTLKEFPSLNLSLFLASRNNVPLWGVDDLNKNNIVDLNYRIIQNQNQLIFNGKLNFKDNVAFFDTRANDYLVKMQNVGMFKIVFFLESATQFFDTDISVVQRENYELMSAAK